MIEADMQRKLTAVLAADVEGFARLTERDEEGTLRTLAALRAIFDSAIDRHRGRIANTAGDSLLAEFPSAADAVCCAVEVQNELDQAVSAASADRRLRFRIGVHLGDVLARGGDLLGNGVNIAARLQSIAPAGGIIVSAAVYEQVRSSLALQYANLGPQQIKNIDEPVQAFEIIGTSPASTGGALPNRLAQAFASQSQKPSIAVLPFQNMSGDGGQDYFADGLTEELMAALSKWRWFLVIARNSAFAYKGRTVDARVVGKELSARYLLEGSVRKSADRLRLMAQLIDTVDGTQVWAERFDGSAADIFDLQDQLTNKVVTSLRPHLTQAELKRSQRKRPESLDSWDLYLRATALYYETNRNANEQAIALLARAIDLDRNFASPYARMSACKIQAAYHGWAPDTVAIAREARELGTRATQLDPADPLGFDALASAHVFLGENEEGLRAARRALDIDPNLSAAQGTVVSTLALLGRPDEAIAAFERSEQHNPFDPDRSGRLMGLVIALFGVKRYDQCAAAAREHILLRPAWFGSRVFLAAALARMHQLAEARRAVAELQALVPRYTITRASNRPMFSDRRMFDDLIDALRTAGLPES